MTSQAFESEYFFNIFFRFWDFRGPFSYKNVSYEKRVFQLSWRLFIRVFPRDKRKRENIRKYRFKSKYIILFVRQIMFMPDV